MAVCKEGFAFENRVIGAGEELADDDPIVRRFAQFFESPVEQATAGPGEKRSTRRPPAKKKAAAKKPAARKD